jgi:Ca-activated chloride channel family protein
MVGTDGERVALQDVSVDATLRDLLAEVTVAQTYRNDEDKPIEAVYTFPLPVDAVLLDFTVTLGKRELRGIVVERKDAEARYEEAIESGDAAVMLEALEPGLYTMNVGNLLPREVATIRFRYALLHRWSGDKLRMLLPTTVAPRYGRWDLQPHQVPESSLSVENRFSLRVSVQGLLQEAQFDCPTHAVTLTRDGKATVLSLQADQAVMDRDFVLNVRAPQAPRNFALCGVDAGGDRHAVLASFQPFFPGLRAPASLNLCVVVDCSGSMTGDSIAQAKVALEGILERLTPEDRIGIVAFGSRTRCLSDRLLSCMPANLAKARRFARGLDADLGGTEIGAALAEARATLGDESGDIFLVTDGQATDWQTVIDEAAAARHRVFTVGVGSAVSEAFLQALAARTGGHCELVSPREGMADRVVRHFERMRAPRARHVSLRWPDGASNVFPSTFAAVFEGDTVLASATLPHAKAAREAILEVETERGEVFRQTLPIPASDEADGAPSTVARVAAASRLGSLDQGAALRTALDYQLMSRWTNYLVVAERTGDEKADGMPELRKVPQTLVAGWGGSGSVVRCVQLDPAMFEGRDAFDRSGFAPDVALEFASTSSTGRHQPSIDYARGRERLLTLIDADPSRLVRGELVALLQEAGLASLFDALLEEAVTLGIDPELIAEQVIAHIGGGTGELSPGGEVALALLRERAHEAAAVAKELHAAMSSLHHLEHRALTAGIADRPREAWLERAAEVDKLFKRALKIVQTARGDSRTIRIQDMAANRF